MAFLRLSNPWKINVGSTVSYCCLSVDSFVAVVCVSIASLLFCAKIALGSG